MYYGRVQDNIPVFQIRSGQDGDQSRVYTVNGKADRFSTFRQMPMLRRQSHFNSMLVFAIEDSSDGNESARLEVARTRNHHLVALVNGTSSKAYSIHISKGNQLISTEQYSKMGVSLRIVNVSQDTKNNWRLSSYIKWNDFSKAEQPYQLEETKHRLLKQVEPTINRQLSVNETTVQQSRKYTAIVFQISMPEYQVGNIKVNINELKIKHLLDGPSDSLSETIFRSVEPIDTIPQIVQKTMTCAQDAVDKLFRGLSFEYGSIHIINGSMPIKNQPRALLSFSPSRKRFPWGFLWDDGFHNAIAARYEPQLSVKVICSWLDTMIDGWIPREQDRGTERENLCNCPMFLAKDIRDGNPPSLLLPLTYLLQNGYLQTQQFKNVYWKKLKEWHAWFMRTQMTNDEYLFKWFDHIQSDGSFNSGMDDFPRPLYTQYHIDAQSWMYALTQLMVKASREFQPQMTPVYEQKLHKIKANLRIFQSNGIYVDMIRRPGSSLEGSPHIGYGSILPLAFGMLDPKTQQFKNTLKLLTDTAMLNTSHGLSSIHRSSPQYLVNKDAYWRGPVWINMNYLALRGLKLYYSQQARDVYDALRKQLTDTVCGEWERKKYFFQNYIEGVGSFSYPFNGWTSLIANIINEHY